MLHRTLCGAFHCLVSCPGDLHNIHYTTHPSPLLRQQIGSLCLTNLWPPIWITVFD